MSSLFDNQLIWISNVILSCIDFVEDLFEWDGDDKTHASDTPAVPQLPDLAIFEILLKLPIVSLVQCRHVCKLWNQLISDPYFTRVYFKNNSPPAVFAITHHTGTNSPDPPVDLPANYVEIKTNGYLKPTPLNLNPVGTAQSNKSWKRIIASYDGLLCLVETPRTEDYFDLTCLFTLRYPNQQVWILNPLIGERVALPKVKAVREFTQVAYGFGSTADGNHYKVVRFAMDDSACVVEGQILTIGVDDEWRDVDISEVPFFLYSNGVALNGVLHFVCSYDLSFRSHGVIYAFDLMTETGHCFALPCAVRRRGFRCEFFLAIWDGHLCLTDSSNKFQVDIWTMKLYGVVESWTRNFLLRSLICIPYGAIIPIATMRNGDLLISHDNRLFSCTAETKNCVELKITRPIFNPEELNSFVSGYVYTPVSCLLRILVIGIHLSLRY